MKIRRIAGLNQPITGPFVRVTVNHTVDPEPANLKLIEVQPSVAKLRIVPQEYSIDLQGAFDTRVEYRVTLKSRSQIDFLRFEEGFGLEGPFPPKAAGHYSFAGRIGATRVGSNGVLFFCSGQHGPVGMEAGQDSTSKNIRRPRVLRNSTSPWRIRRETSNGIRGPENTVTHPLNCSFRSSDCGLLIQVE